MHRSSPALFESESSTKIRPENNLLLVLLYPILTSRRSVSSNNKMKIVLLFLATTLVFFIQITTNVFYSFSFWKIIDFRMNEFE